MLAASIAHHRESAGDDRMSGRRRRAVDSITAPESSAINNGIALGKQICVSPRGCGSDNVVANDAA